MYVHDRVLVVKDAGDRVCVGCGSRGVPGDGVGIYGRPRAFGIPDSCKLALPAKRVVSFEKFIANDPAECPKGPTATFQSSSSVSAVVLFDVHASERAATSLPEARTSSFENRPLATKVRFVPRFFDYNSSSIPFAEFRRTFYGNALLRYRGPHFSSLSSFDCRGVFGGACFQGATRFRLSAIVAFLFSNGTGRTASFVPSYQDLLLLEKTADSVI